jgi:hypothetical protein
MALGSSWRARRAPPEQPALTFMRRRRRPAARETGGLAQSHSDLVDLLRLRSGREDRGLRRKVVRERALGLWLLGDDEVLSGLRMRSVEDGDDLAEVLGGEAVEL